MKAASKTNFVPRKRQERGERRISAIVAAAAQLFAKYGFDGTSMNGIAQTSGLSIGSLYQYFPNKDAIVDAVADDYVRAWQKHVNAKVFVDVEPVTLQTVINLGFAAMVDFNKRHIGVKAFLDADPRRAPSIRAVQENIDVGVPLVTKFYPHKSPVEIARTVFIAGAIMRNVAPTIAAEKRPAERASFVAEVADFTFAYVVSRLGEPAHNVSLSSFATK
jgi:AcrR family transcriptional regulator